MSYSNDLYECSSYPCFHVVADHRHKKLAVYLELSDGDIIYIPLNEFIKAYETLSKYIKKHYSEAIGREIDYLASKFLGAEPLEEE